MRHAIPAALVLLLAMPVAAEAQSSREACEMLDPALMEEAFGAPPELVERSGEGTGISFCNWTGGEGLYIKITSLTAAVQGIVGGTPLDYFLMHQANDIESMGAANVAPVDGPWQAGHRVDVTTEDNSQQSYSTRFINKDDTVTFDTFGLARDTHARLAEAVANGM